MPRSKSVSLVLMSAIVITVMQLLWNTTKIQHKPNVETIHHPLPCRSNTPMNLFAEQPNKTLGNLSMDFVTEIAVFRGRYLSGVRAVFGEKSKLIWRTSATPPKYDYKKPENDLSFLWKNGSGIHKNMMIVAHKARHDVKALTIEAQSRNTENVALYLIGDETNEGSSYLTLSPSPWAYVVRDYYHDELKDSPLTKVVQLGTMACGNVPLLCDVSPPSVVFTAFLRTANEMGHITTALKSSERSNLCFWSGSLRKDRQKMVNYFQENGGCHIIQTAGFKQGLDAETYTSFIANSVFALVPPGNSPETHRLAEAIQSGAIPAMLTEDALTPHMLSYPFSIPVIHGSTWDIVSQKMEELVQHPTELDAMQKDVLEWQDKYWKCAHEDMNWITSQAYAQSQGIKTCSSE